MYLSANTNLLIFLPKSSSVICQLLNDRMKALYSFSNHSSSFLLNQFSIYKGLVKVIGNISRDTHAVPSSFTYSSYVVPRLAVEQLPTIQEVFMKPTKYFRLLSAPSVSPMCGIFWVLKIFMVSHSWKIRFRVCWNLFYMLDAEAVQVY